MRRFLAAAAAALVAAWLLSLVAVVRAAHRDAAAPADAIVVLGAAQYNGRPSPVFRSRLDHAAALLRRHLAPRLLVTGGIGTGDTVSEAVAGRRYLVSRGADATEVVAIPTGRSTEPSLQAAATWIRSHGGQRAILVSDDFHMLRLSITARRLGLVPLGSPARASPIAANRRLEVAYLLAESFKVPITLLFTR